MAISSKQSQEYPLGRSTMAATRLDLQHYAWTASLGFHLHPIIPLADDAMIADVGCGTAIWSCTFPRGPTSKIRIEASDISLSQVPPAAWLPEYITSRQLDILAETLPEELLAKYDVIHVRLLMLVVQNNDPLPILRNLLKMLKPGGYIQWQEYDLKSVAVKTVGGNSAQDAPNLTALCEFINGGMSKEAKTVTAQFNTSWVMQFHELVASSSNLGAEVTTRSVAQTPAHLLPLRQACNFLGAKEYASTLGSMNAEAGDRLEELVNAAEEECWQKLGRGGAMNSDLLTYVFKKSMA